MILVALHICQIEIWRGHIPRPLHAEDTVEAALLQGGDLGLSVALTRRATVAAYAGREDDARADAAAALTACQRCGARRNGAACRCFGFSGGLTRQLRRRAAHPRTPAIRSRHSTPSDGDQRRRLGAARRRGSHDRAGSPRRGQETLIKRLEDNGRRLNRPWMLAVGARCRAMLLAAAADVDAAAAAAQAAIEGARAAADALRTCPHSAAHGPTPASTTPKKRRVNPIT